MIDLRHPLAVLATRMPWDEIESASPPALSVWTAKGVQFRARTTCSALRPNSSEPRQRSGSPALADPTDARASVPQARVQGER